ncbi:apolipoprotein N-acyltransferase [Streptomyces marincola]|uniref:apolipoprotein N-acyltransferase n=1 Tax=Streptomyces marincola TaxID=2878388 RepID=UPI001CF25731|nr:apolipoprotein N-acyltransferase [Streptomyces marincola]UCM86756.1 apolipoprotein N-acyltransferase [Streptomyces marincola]
MASDTEAAGPQVSAPRPGPRPAAPRRPGRLRRAGAALRAHWRAELVAVAAGLALAAAFPPIDIWPLSIVAVAALSVLTRGRTWRQGAWFGFLLAFSFFIGLLQWLRVIGWDTVVGLSLVQALFFVPLGAGLAATSRLPAWPLWAACLWVAQEWARDRVPLGGFPWGRLAFANTGTPFTPLAALGGAPLVTFAVALTGALLAWAVVRLLPALGSPRRPALPGRAVALPAFGATGLAAAVAAAGYAVPVPTDADDTVSVAVVQGNVQQPGMDFLGRPMLILNNHVEATIELADDVAAGRVERPDLVLWPENASDLDPYREPEARAAIERAVDAVGVPILVGALVDHPTRDGYVENQGIVWDPETGPGDSYTKQHPVPFGEYVPFREQLSKVISRLERVPRDFYPGEEPGVLDVGPARLGDVICFEVAYDGIVRDTVNAGARALVVQTNNATYGHTGQPEQQLAMSRLRAVEHGRAIVTAATSGISAVVAPDGTIEQQTEEFTRDVLTAELPLRDDRTVADRVGAAPEWALTGLGLLTWAGAVVLARRGRADRKESV